MPSDAKVPRDPVNGLVKVKIIEGRVALSPSNLVPLPLLLFFAQASQGVGYLLEFPSDFRLGIRHWPSFPQKSSIISLPLLPCTSKG